MGRPFLFSVVLFPFSFGKLLLLLWTVLMLSCSSAERTSRPMLVPQETSYPENSPMVEGQVIPPDEIRSIQLYRGTRKASLPAIELGTSDFVTLRFDELSSSTRMFRVRLIHRNADWSPSVLSRQIYLSGYREDLIQGGEPGRAQNPSYVHYQYRFPNENMRVKYSGNYLLEVLDYETSELLFSVPFFVYENSGILQFETEELYGMDPRYTVHHQPFASYRYPRFIISPSMDLRVFFVQNRFWGRAREADEIDISEQGIFRAYLSRPESFVGVYEFRPLNLDPYDISRPDVVEIRSHTVPPRVYLFRDVVNLDVNPRRRSPSLFGTPSDTYTARYVDVHFELEIPHMEDAGLPVYVYGPFNNWSIKEANRMEYQSETRSYTGRALIKEGQYDYKYALVDRNRVDDLRLDASFASTAQEYTSFVYFRDPAHQVDRLLQMQTDRVH